ncbi:MAG: hypothetical protein A3F83_04475 [Candidatus Glassbacteria bacterium RIFCSPLOWO2_12_FULL_58_11]|uniref:M23ase beta-sheet core domain-containing protein n=1 Tax=Candidatus Glassbacteria bacterium RIFCSPLOWO2_12_FULL_58_11 TaxID=1817867 RepID=A0A1F5YW60_9BACT|nr:MAG: hypothetical protein A3F83_04475 [Candidatus Glassbacteria bacterium RIFCSPLOWO2_12_FULL_58_11]
MKNKMYLMIFYSNGRSRNIGFDLIRSTRLCATTVAIAFLLFTGMIAYNFYQLSMVRNVHSQTMQSYSVDQQKIKTRLVSLESFEEKISFYLGGVLEDGENLDTITGGAGGMGGGEELDLAGSDLEAPSEGSDITFIAQDHESESTEERVSRLKIRLEELADQALQEKNRLEYTPSILPSPGYMTSRFGWRRSPFTGGRHFHRGIDLVNKIGTPVKASASGTVLFSGPEEYWGNAIFISHRDGIISKYGHLSKTNVHAGELVHRGEVIGQIGMTGRTTGPHLHYQIEIKDKAVDPTQFIIEEID